MVSNVLKKNISRALSKAISKDLTKKMVLLSGPRQCGKTTFAKSLTNNYEYLNYDNLDDRSQLLKREWDRNTDLLIFDELHKMPKWKSWLKGIYDKESAGPSILVTGSSRLDTFRRTGDSLAGRHYYYRLHPFDIKELVQSGFELSAQKILERIMTVSGYPEPFINGDIREYRRWRQTHMNLILKQDLPEYELVRDIRSIELLVEILRSKVSSGVSVNSMAIELQKDPKTVLKWLAILEDLFVIFKLTPYSKDISRSIKKEPKYYFYDTAMVQGDEGARFENLVACALLKESHRLLDEDGIGTRFHYLRVKGGKEIDFVLIPEETKLRPVMVEAKWRDKTASFQFKTFQSSFVRPRKIQLVGQDLNKDFSTAEGVEVFNAAGWLSQMRLF